VQPFLKWAGGKRWLIPRLHRKLPLFRDYYEPFLGSGGLFFALRPNQAVLSDSNPELINCFRCIRNHCHEVIRVLKWLPVNRKTYYRVRDKLYPKADKIKRAAYFIYLNKLSWNGLYRVNMQGRFNVPVGRVHSGVEVYAAEQLLAASQLLKRAKLKCCDFEQAVKDSKPGDLVYFDPPYITTHLTNGFIKYNSKLFHHSDELRLAHVAHSLAARGVSVVLSNAAHPLIKQQYDGLFFKTEIQRGSVIAADSARRGKFTELLISNFRLNLAKEE